MTAVQPMAHIQSRFTYDGTSLHFRPSVFSALEKRNNRARDILPRFGETISGFFDKYC